MRADGLGEGGKSIEQDSAWNQLGEIHLCPDPDLNDQTSELVQVEYGMKNGSIKIEIRRAMLWYILRQLGFNPHPKEQISDTVKQMRNESSFSLYLKNLEEVEVWLGRRK